MRRFTTDIVRGLGAFDLDVMLTDPTEQAAYCFKQLFSSFRVRGMLLADEEPIYSEEYMSFLDELRRDHPGILQTKLLIPDVIDFVCGQSSLACISSAFFVSAVYVWMSPDSLFLPLSMGQSIPMI